MSFDLNGGSPAKANFKFKLVLSKQNNTIQLHHRSIIFTLSTIRVLLFQMNYSILRAGYSKTVKVTPSLERAPVMSRALVIERETTIHIMFGIGEKNLRKQNVNYASRPTVKWVVPCDGEINKLTRRITSALLIGWIEKRAMCANFAVATLPGVRAENCCGVIRENLPWNRAETTVLYTCAPSYDTEFLSSSLCLPLSMLWNLLGGH